MTTDVVSATLRPGLVRPPLRDRLKLEHVVMGGAVVALIVLVVLPLLSLLFGSVKGEDGLSFDHFSEVLSGRLYLTALKNSLILGAWTSLFSLVLGLLLAWAVSGAKRAAALPNVPTTLESGVPNSDFDFWVGAFVPKQTPRDIVAKIHRETAATIESAAVKDKLAKLGVEPMIMRPEDFDARIAREVDIAVKLAKAANITSQ